MFYSCSYSVFEKYQKERSAFVQKVADLASHSENIETLQNVGRIFKINFSKQRAKYTLRVKLSIDNCFSLRIRKQNSTSFSAYIYIALT